MKVAKRMIHLKLKPATGKRQPSDCCCRRLTESGRLVLCFVLGRSAVNQVNQDRGTAYRNKGLYNAANA